MGHHRPRWSFDDSGTAAVEFALVLPFFMMLVMGVSSAGLALHQQVVLEGSARESARYGATVSADQCDTSCGEQAWAPFVASRAVAESGGVLEGAEVCVALVYGSGSAPTTVSADHSTETGAAPCFADGVDDDSLRVQVSVTRPSRIEWLLGASDLVLQSDATARFEQ